MRGNEHALTHGHTRVGRYTPEWRTWAMMIQRCENPNATGFRYWGGRGITVCDQWHVFENFLADMGPRPEGTTLNRKDNDGNYEPGNCEWANVLTQQRSKRPRPKGIPNRRRVVG
jgi:hypothetical protein